MDDRVTNLSPLKQALLALEDMQARLDAAERAAHEPIAVIGLSCRFPGGANDPDSFWKLLQEGKDAITEVPRARWDIDAFYDPDPDAPGKMNSRFGGFLESVDFEGFDAQFFRTAPREAASMDPQQRLLLEVAWEALERAGQTQALTRSSTGVFVGIGMNDYSQVQLRSGDPSRIDPYTAAGNFLCFAAGRISFLLGLQGPCLALDTACSSSLVAIHLACQSLRAGECETALAGGVQLILSPEPTIAIARTRALAPDGRCKTFDARADGFVRGEGCGIVVLKRLSDAVAAADNILGVIRGSAVNHDGPSAGLTVPNGTAQENVIRQALKAANVFPHQIGYVEAHGTGTALGDPIEMRALGAVLSSGRPKDRRFVVGSVKTNFGHLEAAAGMAGFIKVILSLQHREIPPHLHVQRVNPHISLEDIPATIPSAAMQWPDVDGRCIAGVSSFGASGTNAHIIVEEYAKPRQEDSFIGSARPHVLPLSARSPEALDATVRSWAEFLGREHTSGSHAFGDICRTAATRRTHHEFRLSLVAPSSDDAARCLSKYLAGEAASVVSHGRKPVGRPKATFVFSGQGPQWQGMGSELFEREPVFRRALQDCDAVLRPHTGWSLIDTLRSTRAELLTRTEVAQPAIFALQHALHELWTSWGIHPDNVVGHSMGEVAACCAAGVFSLQDAARLIALRGQTMSDTAGLGRMVSVELPVQRLATLLQDNENEVSIAAINSPSSTVISGSLTAMDRAEAALARHGIETRRLPANYAFHSSQMTSAGAALARALDGLQPRSANIPIFSTVSGKQAGGLEFNAEYWRRNVVQRVTFGPAIDTILATGPSTFIEVAPHPVLAANVVECVGAGSEARVLPSIRRGQSESGTMLASLCELYSRGFAVEWKNVYPGTGTVVELPVYPWQRTRYRIAPVQSQPLHAGNMHPLLGRPLRSPALRGNVFESMIGPAAPSYLADHVIHGAAVFPAAAYIEMALAAAQTVGLREAVIDELAIREPLRFTSERDTRTLQIVLTPADSHTTFEVFSQAVNSDEWTSHAGGMLRSAPATAASSPHELSAARMSCAKSVDVNAFYRALELNGVEYGSAFRALESLWIGEAEALGHIRIPGFTNPLSERYVAHPVLIDACLQVVGAGLQSVESSTFLPVAFERIELLSVLDGELWSHCRFRETTAGDSRIADVRIYGPDEQLKLEISGLLLRRAARHDRERSPQSPPDWFYEPVWEEAAAVLSADSAASGGWLILADSGGVGASVAQLLEQRGNSVLLARAQEVETFESIQNMLGRVKACRGIVHLWGLDSAFARAQNLPALQADRVRSCRTTLDLLQAVGNRSGTQSAKVWIVTRGTQPISDDSIALAQSAVWGLGRAAVLEHPDIVGGLIDLDPAAPQDEARALLAELHQSSGETQIAFRNGRRLVARLHRKTLASRANAAGIRGDGTYLIAGAFGGLGGELARTLARRGAGCLVLVGRSAPSPGSRSLQHELEQAGVRVVAIQTDISDEAAVSDVVNTITRTLPPLRGVFHVAGVLADGVLLQLDWDRVLKAMAAKVEGAWNLHRLTLDSPLDFFVLFSSAASLLGSPGQGAYSAANAFLDGLAHYRRSLNLPATGINWGPWEQVGMAASSGDNTTRRWAQMGMRMIGLDEGFAALDAALRSNIVQAGVLPVDWSRYSNRLPANARAFVSGLVAVSPESGGSRNSDSQPAPVSRDGSPAEQRDRVRAFIAEHISRSLGSESRTLDLNQPLNLLGFDSLMAVDLRNAIRSGLGTNVQVATILEGACAEDLATHVLNQWTAATLMVSPAAVGSVGNLEEVEI
jgi:myxalamid-type polyketide synthase MxaE and MxaD